MRDFKSNPLMLFLLLSAPLLVSAVRMSAQNSCGSSSADTVTCGTSCPTVSPDNIILFWVTRIISLHWLFILSQLALDYFWEPTRNVQEGNMLRRRSLYPPTILIKPGQQPGRGYQAGNHNKAIIGAWQFHNYKLFLLSLLAELTNYFFVFNIMKRLIGYYVEWYIFNVW